MPSSVFERLFRRGPSHERRSASDRDDCGGITVHRLTVGDVMTREVVTVNAETGFRQIADLLVSRRLSAVPVVDAEGAVLGVVSEADLLPKLEYADRLPHHPLATRHTRVIRRKAGGERAVDLMTAPAISVGPEVSVSRAARMLEAARVKRLPVVDEQRRLVGIVSRRDLVRTYVRSDTELQASVRDMLNALWIDPATVTAACVAGVVRFTGHVERRSTAEMIANVIRSTAGVVDVINDLTFDYDDTDRRHRSQQIGLFDAIMGPH
jgi:CBS domain-containing protein